MPCPGMPSTCIILPTADEMAVSKVLVMVTQLFLNQFQAMYRPIVFWATETTTRYESCLRMPRNHNYLIIHS